MNSRLCIKEFFENTLSLKEVFLVENRVTSNKEESHRHINMPRKRTVKTGMKKSTEEKPKKDPNAEHAFFESRKHNHGKYKHRILESNWAKYEDNSESTQTVSHTGARFDTLVTHSGKEVSTFQFKDDQFMEPEKSIYLENNKQDGKTGSMGFDLDRISAHLSNVPISMKLRLPNVLCSLEIEGCNWHGEYFQHLINHMKSSKVALRTKRASTLSELQWNFGICVPYDKSINSLVKRIKEIDIEKTSVDSKELSKRQEDNRNIEGILKNTNIAMIDQSVKLIKDKNDDDSGDENGNEDDDDELDSILAVKPLSFKRNASLTEVCTSNESKEEKAVVGKVTVNEEETKAAYGECRNKPTESLEDWLDSILE